MNPLLRLGAAVATVVLVLAFPTPAEAHTDLTSSTPANGSSLTELPLSGVLVFDEPASSGDLTVEVAGHKLPVAAVSGRPNALRYGLRRVAPADPVVVDWRLVDAEDGHVSSGRVTFRVAGATVADEPAAAGLAWAAGAAAVAKVVSYLSLVVFVGGLLFVSLLWPRGAGERRTRTVLATAVGAGALSSVACLLIIVARSGSVSLATALTQDYGRVCSALALLWLLASVVVAGLVQGGADVVRRLPWRTGAVAIAVGLLRVSGINAHADQTAHPAWGVAADFLHLVGVSAWVGGLLMLTVCVLPRRDAAELESVVPRFSIVALTSVALVTVSGLVMGWEISGSVDGFWSTRYSHVLISKVVAFGLVLLVATNTKRLVDRGLGRQVEGHRRSPVQYFAASVAAESVIVVAVLGAAAVLTTSSPGL